MDLHSIPEIELVNIYHQTFPPHSLMLSQVYQKQRILHQNPWQQIGCKLSCRCRKLTPSTKRLSKGLSNGKAPQHETDLLTHVRGLLCKHVTDSGQKFLVLVIPKSRKYTVLVEAHNKLGHQGNTHTYHLIKCKYYWKGMNKDIRKYIANCTLCHREKTKVQVYPLQMAEIPDRPFDKITIDLVTECEMSTSGNKHILTINDHLTGWPRSFPHTR